MDIYTMATNGFDAYAKIWQFDDFWTRANTFEACLRFVTAAQAKWPNDPKILAMKTVAKQISEGNLKNFQCNLKQDMWADDYGWCGVASLRARDFLLKLGDTQLAGDYLDVAKACWQKMYSTGYDSTTDAQPVPHGCANSGSSTDPGTKNTVTNANLLLLSVRLYNAMKSIDKTQATAYLEMAYWQYLWFSAWFTPPLTEYKYLLLPSSYGFTCGLAQERPHAPPDYENPDRPTWEPGWAWTGDQGLLLGALVGILQITSDLNSWAKSSNPPINFDPVAFQNDVNGWIKTITMGVEQLLFGKTTDKVLREAPFNSSFSDDPKDYVCGRGVLLRYLSEVKPFLGGVNFDPNIVATAQAAWNSRDTTSNQFGANWNPQNDSSFNASFIKTWGYGDAGVSWPYGTSEAQPVSGILQAVGLDVLGAAIPIVS
jgi:hypothetical protein